LLHSTSQEAFKPSPFHAVLTHYFFRPGAHKADQVRAETLAQAQLPVEQAVLADMQKAGF
jgi:hypothetical protein